MPDCSLDTTAASLAAQAQPVQFPAQVGMVDVRVTPEMAVRVPARAPVVREEQRQAAVTATLPTWADSWGISTLEK
jgi:hypothetical protein